MRNKKNGLPNKIRTLSLAVAMAALSTGTMAAAAADVDAIQIQTPGGILQYNVTGSLSNELKDQMRDQLRVAFESGESIKVREDGATTWVEFSENASKAASLDEMLSDAANALWATTPAASPAEIY